MIAHGLRDSRADQILAPCIWIQARQNKQFRPERLAQEVRAKVDRNQMVVAWKEQLLLRRGSERQEVLPTDPEPGLRRPVQPNDARKLPVLFIARLRVC